MGFIRSAAGFEQAIMREGQLMLIPDNSLGYEIMIYLHATPSFAMRPGSLTRMPENDRAVAS